MKQRKIYISPESEIRMCEEELIRVRKYIGLAEINLENATSEEANAKIFRELEDFEIRLETLQKRHAQLVFTKFGETVNPFGKIVWRK